VGERRLKDRVTLGITLLIYMVCGIGFVPWCKEEIIIIGP
jgi:hypothetical protein